MEQEEIYIVKDDMICPVTKKHCDDECCPVGATCNMSGTEISDCEDNRHNMTFTDEVIITFKNDDGKTAEIEITVQQLLDGTTDDFHEWLDDSEPCTSASCNNESQNFCDCGSSYDDYEITGISFKSKRSC